MKKTLVILLAIMMLFAFSASAMAATFTDTAALTQDQQDDIAKLAALQILSGYPDGSFKAEASITRAEFAKIACTAAGFGSSGDLLKNTASAFSDVKAGQWYTGWVNLATTKGLFAGYPNGTFKPNATITESEVITVLMRLLGYNDNLPGAWPLDYISQAGKLSVLDNVTFTGNVAATRLNVATMTAALLDEFMVVWDKTSEKFDYLTTSAVVAGVTTINRTTLLEDSFKGAVVNGYVADAVAPYSTGWTYNSLGKTQLYVAATYGGAATAYTMADNYTVSGADGITDLAGEQVKVILVNGKAAYVEVVSTSKIYAASKITAFVAGGNATIDSKTYSVVAGAANNAAAANYGIVRINKDNQIYTIQNGDAYDTTAKIVKEITTAKITAFDGSSNTITNKSVLVWKDGALTAGTSALAKYDVVEIFAGVANVDFLYVVADTATATVNGFADGTKVKLGSTFKTLVAGATYVQADTSAALYGTAALVGTEVSYALNPVGKVSAAISGKGAANYVYGLATGYAKFDGSFGGTKVATITLFTEKGETVTYTLKDNTVYDAAAGLTKYDLIKVRLTADGKVDNMTRTAVPTAADPTTANISVSNSKIQIGADLSWYNVTASTIIFNIKSTGPVLLAASDIMTGTSLTAASGIKYVANTAGTALNVLLLNGYGASSTGSLGLVESNNYVTDTIAAGTKFVGIDTVYTNADATPTYANGDYMLYKLAASTLVENADPSPLLIVDRSALPAAAAGPVVDVAANAHSFVNTFTYASKTYVLDGVVAGAGAQAATGISASALVKSASVSDGYLVATVGGADVAYDTSSAIVLDYTVAATATPTITDVSAIDTATDRVAIYTETGKTKAFLVIIYAK